jgi:hypothetical protein
MASSKMHRPDRQWTEVFHVQAPDRAGIRLASRCPSMSRNQAIRTLLVGVLLVAAGGCASQQPFTSIVRRPVPIAAPHDKVFHAVLDAIDDEDLLVHRVDHHQGVITTRVVSLTRGVPRQLQDLCLPFGLEPGRLDASDYSIRLIVASEGSDSSTVELTPRLRFLLTDTPDKWHDCPVEGPLERILIESIVENIDRDPRARGD